MPDILIKTEKLVKQYEDSGAVFRKKHLEIKAVDGVDLKINRGETLGLVGESGCGKSTLGRMLVRLLEPTSGNIYYDGNDITAISGEQLSAYRRNVQIIFQDPLSSLNPRMKIFDLIAEPLIIHKTCAKPQLSERVEALLEKVGLSQIDSMVYPHMLSGGQLQRVGIARALAINPEFLVCDEPVSALDVSIQSQIINLLSDLQKELGLTYLFISHNLAVVRNIADRVAVMYLGKIVEVAQAESFFVNPLHPYSRVLLDAIPEPDPRKKRQRGAAIGEVSLTGDKPSGCAFHPRCNNCADICRTTSPELKAVGNGYMVACHMIEA